MRKPLLAPFVLIGTLTIGTAAHAGCCDDAWSCIAAVATAGLSCQVQGIIDTVKTLSTTVNSLFNDLSTRTAEIINDARHAIELATADVKSIREKALSDLKEAANGSQALANPRMLAMPVAAAKVAPVGANAVAPAANQASKPTATNPVGRAALVSNSAVTVQASADPTAVKNALSRADTYIRDLNSKAAQASRDGTNSEQQALAAVARHVAAASKIATDIALEPLKMLGDSLLDLLNHPERIFDPSAQIDADLKRISDEVPAMLDRIGNEVTQEATSFLEQARKPAQQLQDQAEVASNVLHAMQRVSSSKTQGDLDALNRLLPSNSQGVKAGYGVVLPPGIAGRHELLSSALSRVQVSKLPLIAKHRATVSSIVSQWAQVKSQAKTSIRVDAAMSQKADVSVQQLLGAGSKDDLARRKQRLLDEAQRRFAKDPKTLTKVQQYIQSHVR